MEQMLARNLIRHCSGDTSRQSFMYGFHLYYVLEKDHSSPYQGDRFAFKCDWIEVLFLPFCSFHHCLLIFRSGWSCSDLRETTLIRVIVSTKASDRIFFRKLSGDSLATSGTLTSPTRTKTMSSGVLLWILTVMASRRDPSGERGNTKVGDCAVMLCVSLPRHDEPGE